MDALEAIEHSLKEKCAYCRGTGMDMYEGGACEGRFHGSCAGTGLRYYLDLSMYSEEFRVADKYAEEQWELGRRPPWIIP